jgi:hypothetical protein
MQPIHQWLKDADPIGREAPLGLDELEMMRSRVVTAVGSERATGLTPPQLRLAIAAVVLTASVVAPLAHLWESRETASVSSPAAAATDTRQLQFATPGGTRVIWVFNSEFEP